MDPDLISAVAQDYVKAIWSSTEWRGPAITAKDLAVRFGTSPANVTETMRRLAQQGLVDYAPYKPVRLTALGADYAVAMVRRHRLIETFLVRTLGYDWNEVHDEAERLEHAVSDTLVDRIDDFLQHPEADPHGDPIPDRDGRMAIPRDAVALSAASPGTYVVLRVSDADPARLTKAKLLGLTPGVVIEVDDEGGGFAEDVGAAIWVVPSGAHKPR